MRWEGSKTTRKTIRHFAARTCRHVPIAMGKKQLSHPFESLTLGLAGCDNNCKSCDGRCASCRRLSHLAPRAATHRVSLYSQPVAGGGDVNRCGVSTMRRKLITFCISTIIHRETGVCVSRFLSRLRFYSFTASQKQK